MHRSSAKVVHSQNSILELYLKTEDPNSASASWNAEFSRQKLDGQYPRWPNEVMLKILFGGKNYLKTPFVPQSSWTVLDVGCGFANNLVPFADIGCECHGVDLHPQIAATAHEVMAKRGYEVEICTGSNRDLPYPDSHFDLLLSVNTLHYESSELDLLSALREFRRVLKPGGGLYISTVGPEHEIFRRAKVLGNHQYVIQKYDFRDGNKFFFFDSENHLRRLCEHVFETVETGRSTEKLMDLPLDFLVALCR